jgi:hypothetical protein
VVFRTANAFMAMLFVLATVVQYNDPDPLRWMALYGAAAVLSAWSAARPRAVSSWAPALLGLVALTWGALLGLGVAGQVRFADLFRSWHMEQERVEEAREAIGLFIVAAWMAVLALGPFVREARALDIPGAEEPQAKLE